VVTHVQRLLHPSLPDQHKAMTFLGISILLLATLGGCRALWLDRDRINTGDFKSIRSALEPDLQELFAEAREEFAQGRHLYEMDQYAAQEKYNVLRLRISRIGESDGTAYEVLFGFTSVPHGFGEGYYYSPSGKLPPGAPTYGVVCSKHLDGPWYAFRTVDSSVPSDPLHCPEDKQHQQ
jgi:hypothetical protein